ncbi:putative protein [Arabidopsis thaliana]|uniref:SH3 domain-containing protein n=1 Tax=Arabidopsis thaliana TaxID=3702 RepID=Q9SVJ1_ARATH|nr:SH3 domain-containing protein [Arabidopsis thaliana]AEE87008.1 SH3 domain-containing protein [Arabidopsis thaliana]CAB38822.1 putative protein [Arabidopsis thaliana]CAB80565.1 putative protein [Arabidopsis thaliana]|eukprot:NP_195613.1 SH3 domain-containing protein [Arabidopsis thaliana]
MVSRYPIGGFAFHRHQFHLLLRHLGIFSQKERNFLQVDDEGGWIVVPLTTIIVFTKTLMMAECCEECCEQMEEDAYSEWLREANDGVNASQMHNGTSDAMGYFLGEVMFPYQADSDFELSLSVGDYVVIREVVSSVWAEGECKGNAGWFTYIYIERRDRVFATKVIEVF